MTVNSGRSHIPFPRNDITSANIDKNAITYEKNELLGIVLDSDFCIEDHICNLCKNKQVKNSTH